MNLVDKAFSSLLALALSTSVHADLTRSEVDALVQPLFPQSLVDEFSALNPGSPFDGTYSYVVADFNADGSDVIAVAFTNFERYELAMVSSTGTLLYRGTDLPEFSGSSARLEALEFDGDPAPELAMGVDGGASAKSPTMNYVLDWNGAALQPLTPTSTEGVNSFSDFENASFLDVDGDGIYEIVTEEVVDGDTQSVTYSLLGGDLLKRSDVDIMEWFATFGGIPDSITRTFEILDPNAEFRMVVTNGSPQGENRATSAAISLNGTTLIESTEIDETVASIERDVILNTFNTLIVDINGNPGYIRVTIERLIPSTPAPESLLDFEDFQPADQGLRFGSDLDGEYGGFTWDYTDPAKLDTWGSWTVVDSTVEAAGAGGSQNWLKARASSIGKGAKITNQDGFSFESMKLYTDTDRPAFLATVDVTYRTIDGSTSAPHTIVLQDDMWITVTAADLGISSGSMLKAMWFNGQSSSPNSAKFGLDDFDFASP